MEFNLLKNGGTYTYRLF